MIDDFKVSPERQPSRLDSIDSYKPRTETASSPPSQAPTFTDSPSISRPTPEFKTDESSYMNAAPLQESITEPTSNIELPSPTAKPEPEELLLAAHATPDKPAPKTVRLFRKWDVSKKKLIIFSVLGVLLLAGGTAYALTQQKEPAKPVVKAKVVVPPAPKPIVSPLTGAAVTAEQRDLPVMGVMIENSPNARPQSGLKDAGIVFEAIAEAGITRFLALYQEAQPGNVGPIRSSRPYYLDWTMAFDASYAHVGGSPDALQRIKDIGVKDLDQFFNPSAYHRITSRYAPHNVYSGVNQLTDLAKSKGYVTSTFTPLARKADQPFKAPAPAPAPAATPASTPSSTRPTAKPAAKTTADTRRPVTKIDLGISGAFYNAHYDYDAASNTYPRVMGGAPHKDADTDIQLAPKTVVALVMAYGFMADGFHSQYTTTGSGKMYVFQDGAVTEGTWTKGEPKEQFVFRDDAGKELPLNSGQTWFSVVGDAGKVTFQ